MLERAQLPKTNMLTQERVSLDDNIDGTVSRLLLAFRWNEKPQLLRRASVMIVPHMALLFYGASPGEGVASICSSACYGRVLESER